MGPALHGNAVYKEKRIYTARPGLSSGACGTRWPTLPRRECTSDAEAGLVAAGIPGPGDASRRAYSFGIESLNWL